MRPGGSGQAASNRGVAETGAARLNVRTVSGLGVILVLFRVSPASQLFCLNCRKRGCPGRVGCLFPARGEVRAIVAVRSLRPFRWFQPRRGVRVPSWFCFAIGLSAHPVQVLRSSPFPSPPTTPHFFFFLEVDLCRPFWRELFPSGLGGAGLAERCSACCQAGPLRLFEGEPVLPVYASGNPAGKPVCARLRVSSSGCFGLRGRGGS